IRNFSVKSKSLKFFKQDAVMPNNMTNTLRYGRAVYSYGHFDPEAPCQPNPIIEFSPIWAEGKHWHPRPGDRTALLLLRRRMPKQVSLTRAYRGWRASG